MTESLTLSGKPGRRILSFIAGLGMIVTAGITVSHFYAANYPESIYEGSVCDISAFFNCDSSAFSVFAQIAGVPIGYFGAVVGALVLLGVLFPSDRFERTNKTIALVNVIGVLVLFLLATVYLRSLCLYCAGFYLFSIFSFILFAKHGIDHERQSFLRRYSSPSVLHLATFGVATLAGSYGFAQFTAAKQAAQSGGVAADIVAQFFELPLVPTPSLISPHWTAKATERFEDAPIRVIEYADLLCPDCFYLAQQLDTLKREFSGRINIAFQHFPLEAKCNGVVEKDLHPGACDIHYIAAYDSEKFLQIHDEVFANFRTAKTSPEWRHELAVRYGVEKALTDSLTKDLVHRIIETGTEYEQTSERYVYGIRSTPTMIINNRMIIGTLPYEQLRAIFQALVNEVGTERFMENWVERGG
jgi:uncharacterized membrane protein/protein-disulfide isomerase